MSKLKDVAKISGVAISTASRILNGDSSRTIKPETAKKVIEAAKAIGYVKSTIKPARNSSKGESGKNVCIMNSIYENFSDPFFSKLLVAIKNEFRQSGLELDFAYTYDDLSRLGSFQGLFSNNLIGSLILLCNMPSDALKKLKTKVSNIICISDLYDIINYEVDCIGYDSKEAIAQCVDFLAAKGHKDILFITGDYNNTLIQDNDFGIDLTPPPDIRKEGYIKGLERNSLKLHNSLIQIGFWDYESSYSIIENVYGKIPFSAVIAANDKMALGAMNCLIHKGLNIPQDIAVIGFDDIELAQYTNPPLTTVHVPIEELGRMAVQKVLYNKQSTTPQISKTIIPCSLTIRQST